MIKKKKNVLIRIHQIDYFCTATLSRVQVCAVSIYCFPSSKPELLTEDIQVILVSGRISMQEEIC